MRGTRLHDELHPKEPASLTHLFGIFSPVSMLFQISTSQIFARLIVRNSRLDNSDAADLPPLVIKWPGRTPVLLRGTHSRPQRENGFKT